MVVIHAKLKKTPDGIKSTSFSTKNHTFQYTFNCIFLYKYFAKCKPWACKTHISFLDIYFWQENNPLIETYQKFLSKVN